MNVREIAILVNGGLTIGERYNAIENFYNPLLTEFYHMRM